MSLARRPNVPVARVTGIPAEIDVEEQTTLRREVAFLRQDVDMLKARLTTTNEEIERFEKRVEKLEGWKYGLSDFRSGFGRVALTAFGPIGGNGLMHTWPFAPKDGGDAYWFCIKAMTRNAHGLAWLADIVLLFVTAAVQDIKWLMWVRRVVVVVDVILMGFSVSGEMHALLQQPRPMPESVQMMLIVLTCWLCSLLPKWWFMLFAAITMTFRFQPNPNGSGLLQEKYLVHVGLAVFFVHSFFGAADVRRAPEAEGVFTASELQELRALALEYRISFPLLKRFGKITATAAHRGLLNHKQRARFVWFAGWVFVGNTIYESAALLWQKHYLEAWERAGGHVYQIGHATSVRG